MKIKKKKKQIIHNNNNNNNIIPTHHQYLYDASQPTPTPAATSSISSFKPISSINDQKGGNCSTSKIRIS